MTGVADPPAPEKSAPEPPRRLRDYPKAAIVAVTAVVALAAGLAGLVFDLWPQLRPDPRSEQGADLAVIAVERSVTLGDWMRRSSGSPEEFRRRRAEYIRQGGSAAGLRFPGELVYLDVSVRGFKRRGVALNWAIYDGRTQERTKIESSVEQGQDTNVRLGAPRDEFVAELWLEPVFGPRRYFVRAEAREADGTLLAVADSKPFRGLPYPRG